MKIEMYINDTLHERPPTGHLEDNIHTWGKISKKRMKKYCEHYDIKLSYHNEEDPYHGILDSFYYKFYQDELLRFRSNEWYKSLSGFTYWCCATLKKIIRWYRFVESDNDIALFVDLDILPLKFVDIRNYIRPNELGISYAPRNASERVYGWYDENWYDNKWLMASAKHLSTKTDNIIQSSSMAIVNREHGIKILEILEKEDLNPLTEIGYKNIIEFSRNAPQGFVQHDAQGNPSVLDIDDFVGLPYDELLLNMAINSDDFVKPKVKVGRAGVDTSKNPSIYNLNKDLLFDICFQKVDNYEHAEKIVEAYNMPFCHFGGAPAKHHIHRLDELYPYE